MSDDLTEKMKVEETISKWFEKTGIELRKCGLQNGFDKLKFECLTQLFYFLQAVCNYYELKKMITSKMNTKR